MHTLRPLGVYDQMPVWKEMETPGTGESEEGL